MNVPASAFDAEDHRKKWLIRLADELEKIEPLMPIKMLPDGIEYPQWVLNVEREFSLVMLPAAKLRNANYNITPKRMGALIGHLCEMAVWMMECFASAPTQIVEIAQKDSPHDDLTNATETCASMNNWYNAVRRFAKLSLCSCVDQPYQDMADFLLGYADGFAQKPKTLQIGNLGNPTFDIYIFMLLHWRRIQCLESAREFHGMLVKNFGASRVGEQKRVEKICQRMDLHFRAPGRPKKLK